MEKNLKKMNIEELLVELRKRNKERIIKCAENTLKMAENIEDENWIDPLVKENDMAVLMSMDYWLYSGSFIDDILLKQEYDEPYTEIPEIHGTLKKKLIKLCEEADSFHIEDTFEMSEAITENLIENIDTALGN